LRFAESPLQFIKRDQYAPESSIKTRARLRRPIVTRSDEHASEKILQTVRVRVQIDRGAAADEDLLDRMIDDGEAGAATPRSPLRVFPSVIAWAETAHPHLTH